MNNPYKCCLGIEGHVALDRNPGLGYNTILFRLIPGYLYSACPQRQFHTIPGLVHIRAALPNFYPNACMPSRGNLYQFSDGLWYDRLGWEPTTYHMRDRRVNYLTIPTQSNLTNRRYNSRHLMQCYMNKQWISTGINWKYISIDEKKTLEIFRF